MACSSCASSRQATSHRSAMPTKPIRKVWTFRSDSTPDVTYETLAYTDGTTSCDCKGWTRRITRDGSRSCKHTRWVDQGQADYHCQSSHDYTERNAAVSQTSR